MEAGKVEEDYDDIAFDGEEIRIWPAIQRNLLANIPYRFLCDEDCAGLCQHCGKDLNHHACNCADAPKGVFADLLAKIETGGVNDDRSKE